MKTAVSLPDPVFHAAESLAHRLGMSRSQLFREALEAYIASHDDEHIREALDNVYSTEPSGLDSALAQLQWASLPPPARSGPEFRRPVVVLQSDPFNRSRISTVVVVAVTTNLRLADAPGNVLLEQRVSGLPRDSTINVSQILTLDKSFLTERFSVLPGGLLARVESGLRLVLGLLTTHPLDIIFIGRTRSETSRASLDYSLQAGEPQFRHFPAL